MYLKFCKSSLPQNKFSNKNECNHLPLYIPCLFFYFISNQCNNSSLSLSLSFSTMLCKNFLKLFHHETALCFNSGGTCLLLLQTLHKPWVGKFPNDNSFSVKPSRVSAGYARWVSKSALASSRGNLRAHTCVYAPCICTDSGKERKEGRKGKRE